MESFKQDSKNLFSSVGGTFVPSSASVCSNNVFVDSKDFKTVTNTTAPIWSPISITSTTSNKTKTNDLPTLEPSNADSFSNSIELKCLNENQYLPSRKKTFLNHNECVGDFRQDMTNKTVLLNFPPISGTTASRGCKSIKESGKYYSENLISSSEICLEETKPNNNYYEERTGEIKSFEASSDPQNSSNKSSSRCNADEVLKISSRSSSHEKTKDDKLEYLIPETSEHQKLSSPHVSQGSTTVSVDLQTSKLRGHSDQDNGSRSRLSGNFSSNLPRFTTEIMNTTGNRIECSSPIEISKNSVSSLMKMPMLIPDSCPTSSFRTPESPVNNVYVSSPHIGSTLSCVSNHKKMSTTNVSEMATNVSQIQSIDSKGSRSGFIREFSEPNNQKNQSYHNFKFTQTPLKKPHFTLAHENTKKQLTTQNIYDLSSSKSLSSSQYFHNLKEDQEFTGTCSENKECFPSETKSVRNLPGKSDEHFIPHQKNLPEKFDSNILKRTKTNFNNKLYVKHCNAECNNSSNCQNKILKKDTKLSDDFYAERGESKIFREMNLRKSNFMTGSLDESLNNPESIKEQHNSQITHLNSIKQNEFIGKIHPNVNSERKHESNYGKKYQIINKNQVENYSLHSYRKKFPENNMVQVNFSNSEIGSIPYENVDKNKHLCNGSAEKKQCKEESLSERNHFYMGKVQSGCSQTIPDETQSYYLNTHELNKPKIYCESSVITNSKNLTLDKNVNQNHLMSTSVGQNLFSSIKSVNENGIDHGITYNKSLMNKNQKDLRMTPDIKENKMKYSRQIVTDQSKTSNSELNVGHNMKSFVQPIYSEKNELVSMNRNSLALQTFEQDNVKCIPENVAREKETSINSKFTHHLQKIKPLISSVEENSTCIQPMNENSRIKKESPLDLSVKTIRQSADSTAKDDREIHQRKIQHSFYGKEPIYSETQFSNIHSNDVSVGAPKIDFNPNFAGLNGEKFFPNVTPQPKFENNGLGDSFNEIHKRTKECREEFCSPILISSSKKTSSSRMVVPDRTTIKNYVDEKKIDENDKLLFPYETIHGQSFMAKIPKVNSWTSPYTKPTEQKLNSIKNAQDSTQNLDVVSKSVTCYRQKHSNGISHPLNGNTYLQTPDQTSKTPYNPAYVQQPECHLATPQAPQAKVENLVKVAHSPDAEQIIRQISNGVMPDYKLLQDKNVFSILKSSLEEKEAKLMQLKEVARNREKRKEILNAGIYKKPVLKFCKPNSNNNNSNIEVNQCKQSLPSFESLASDKMQVSLPSNQSFNLLTSHVPVKEDIKPIQKYYNPTLKHEVGKSGIPLIDPGPQDVAQGPPTDLDGLAAFLAARIRTKGELKQVGPVFQSGKISTNEDEKNHLKLLNSEKGKQAYFL